MTDNKKPSIKKISKIVTETKEPSVINTEDGLQRRFLELEEKFSDFETRFQLAKKAVDSRIESISQIRNSIFALMAMFFGVFAFLSVDIQFSHALVKLLEHVLQSGYFIQHGEETITTISGFAFSVGILLAFLAVQFIVLYMVYRFIVKPFIDLTKK